MIYHWCPAAAWEEAGDEYRPASLHAEGFIHCSYFDQAGRTATALARGAQDLVLLAIDDAGLPVSVEDCYDSGEAFPHLYGPLPRRAVRAVVPFPPRPDGTFQVPPGLPPP